MKKSVYIFYKKKFLIFIIISMILANNLYCQNKEYKSLFLELFGNGGLYSINYEQHLFNSIHGRIGLSYTFGFPIEMFLMPVLLSYFDNEDDFTLEYGIGMTFGRFGGFLTKSDTKYRAVMTGVFGIRSKNEKGGFWRLSYTPLYNPHTGKHIHFGGISFGSVL